MELLNAAVPYTHTTIADVLIAILAFIIGYILVSIVMDLVKRSLKRTHMPRMLIDFLVKFIKWILLVFVLLAVLPILKINISSVVLGISAILGMILGFGLQDTMTNVFAGLWIAMLKPFEIGDYVELNGIEGRLENLGVMATTLHTLDNKQVLIPNKLVWGSPIINHTKMEKRMVSVNVGVAYGTNLTKAIKVAMKVMNDNKDILGTPTPQVIISELADSSINLQLRAWVKTKDYWNVRSTLAKEVVEKFSKSKIEIPFPQMDVHLKKK